MDLMVLDAKYDAIAVVDSFKSAIWTVRYNSAGDFELYLPATKKNLDIFQENRYLWRRDSDRLMIIDSITIETDADDVPMLTVTGESLESLLKRRIIANYTSINGNLQQAIKKLINENIINPSLSERIIPNFIFKDSTDSAITSLTMDEEGSFHGETVYEAVETLCIDKKIGFRVLPYGAGGFQFELYSGTDRSYAQTENPYVVFSPSFENLLSSRYIKTLSNYRNICCSIGTWQEEIVIPKIDESGNQSTETITIDHNVIVWATKEKSAPTGLARREVFLDNSSLDGEEKKNDSKYWESVAINKGKEELQNYELTTAIDGELHGEWQWEYGKDYFLGDKVQVINEFDMESTSYISEIVFSADDTGERVIPTFTSTDDKANEIM